MYAIVDIAGKQIKVQKNQKIFVHHLEGDTGSTVHFNKVLLIDNDKNILIGNPLVSDALITGKILSHLKGDKIKVFKKKKRKGYKVLKGHRQSLTEIQIEDIIEKGASKIFKDFAVLKIKKEPVKPEKAAKGKKAVKPVSLEAMAAPVSEIEILTEPAIVPAQDKTVKTTKKPVLKPKKTQAKGTEKIKSTPGKKATESKARKAGTGKPGEKTSQIKTGKAGVTRKKESASTDKSKTGKTKSSKKATSKKK